jgi:5-formyltetrahydrofolate cyclo-ligase
VVAPVLAFDRKGGRLGQGGGHYDRWLARYPEVTPVGMAWDSQLVDDLPLEPHDRRLRAVVTPTRLFEGEA